MLDGLDQEQLEPEVEDDVDKEEQVAHLCWDVCKRHFVWGGLGPDNWCRKCQVYTSNGRDACQRCVCVGKKVTPFKDRPGGTCGAWVLGTKCEC